MPPEPRPTCLLLAEEVWGSTLQAIRSLGAHGIRTLVATAGEGSDIYRRSRHCAAAADFSEEDPTALCDAVRDWALECSPGGAPIVVIPLSDRLVEYLHRARDRFPDRFRLSVPTPAVAEELLDKRRSLAVATSAGLDVPAWRIVDRPEALDDCRSLTLPVIIRPTSWSTIGDVYFKVAVARTWDDLARTSGDALDRGAELLIQEYIESSDRAVEFAIAWRSRDGSTTASCTGRKRRQSSSNGGVMVWGEAVDLPDVRAAAVRFLDASKFTGLGGLEVIRHGDRLWFVEFNPRLEAIHFLAAQAGVDTLTFEFDELASGRRPRPVATQTTATAWVGSAWLTRLMTNPHDWRTALKDRVDFARSPSRIRAVMSWRDPVPALAVCGRLVRRGTASRRNRRTAVR